MQKFFLVAALALGLAACTSTPPNTPVAAAPVAACETPFEAVMQALEPGNQGLVVYSGEQAERWLFYWNNWPPVGEYVFANDIVPVTVGPNQVTALLFTNRCLSGEVDMDVGLALLLHECVHVANETKCNAALNDALRQSRGPNVNF